MSIRDLIGRAIKDRDLEPHVRWMLRRLRGFKTPFIVVRNEIFDRQTGEIGQLVLRDSSNTVDVGCHRGKFLNLFLRIAPRGRHLAFEPVPQLAADLRVQFPTAEVFDLALCDRSGEAPFFVVPGNLALSSLNRREEVVGRTSRDPIPIRTERLDVLVPPEVNIDLIKIDAEGAEGLVIAGAIRTIERCRPVIVFEHFRHSAKLFGSSSVEIYEMLVEQCGLVISAPGRWIRGRAALSRAEFESGEDGFFVAHPPSGCVLRDRTGQRG